MPHLGLDTTYAATDAERRRFVAAATDRYIDAMATARSHVAVTVRAHSPAAMALGRAERGPIAVLHADVRRGRPFEHRREFALAVIDWLGEAWGIPRANAKVVYTEHPGRDMMGADRVGEEWDGGVA